MKVQNKYKYCVLLVSSIFFIATSLSFSYNVNTQNNNSSLNKEETSYLCENKEKNHIGVWVPYMDLDISDAKETEKEFKKKFKLIIEKSKEFKVNNIYVHVHPFCDALYDSKIYPWSHLLTGIQGKHPGFDPLKYMIDISHENNIKFHAWFNPLRVKISTMPYKLAKENPFYKFENPKYFFDYNNATWLNPGYKETKNIVIEGVKEIASNYDVDGIHFDDYFYPESFSIKDIAYEEENLNNLNVENWRKTNITDLINQVYKEIKKINSNIEFGISPPGTLKGCNLTGLDVQDLCSSKSLDYICPQIYWSLEFEIMPFEKTAIKWKEILKGSNIKLYCGLALYKIQTDLDNETWKNDKYIIPKEIDILNNLNYDGIIMYSWNCLNSSKEEIENINKKLKG